MNHWVTTHWPPREGDTRPVASGVWLPHDRADVGRDLGPGDLVAVYQAQGGRTLVRVDPDGTRRRVPCRPGRGGVIALGEVQARIARDDTSELEQYADGTAVHWEWYAPLAVLSQSGFVSREALNRILGFDEGYLMRGFGDRNSGLKRVDAVTFERIRAAFVAGRPATPAFPVTPRAGGPPGGEGEPHRMLKEYVAGVPEMALGEAGLVLRRMEHQFPTGDRADVVLDDRYGRVVGVEVEVRVGDDDVEGFLQAIKYARMLEPTYGREPGDGRAVLAAYAISPRMRDRCARYGVECVEVAAEAVRAWHAGSDGSH